MLERATQFVIALALFFFTAYLLEIAQAQLSNGVTTDQVNAIVSNAVQGIMNIMPTPYAGVPLGPNGSGVVGSGLAYVPGNAAQVQGVQRTNIATDATGAWTVTWNTSFVSSTPTVAVNALNAAAATTGQAIVCNVIARNATAANGKCWQTNVALVSLLGISITVAPTIPTTGIPIMVVGAEPTQ